MHVEYCLWAQVAILDIYYIYWTVWDRYMQVLYLGRAPRTKETLPDFLKWRRLTRHPLVFRGLTSSQRTPGFWGVTAWYQSFGIRIPRELGLGYTSPLGGMMRSIGIWEPMGRKFGLRPWLRKSITTRCGLMLSLGMGLPRKITGQN